ncbi:MAG: phytoene desaturase family protein [Halanaeroarchaeum sp.]
MDALQGTRIVVVGAGFGGLASASYLADAGAAVTVVERNDQVGGRATVFERDGFRFDMGPSWYLMPDVFADYFGDFGRTPDEFYSLERLDPHYRVFFKENVGARPAGEAPGLRVDEDGDVFDVTSDREQVKAVFEAYEEGAGEALDRYLEQSRENYEVGLEHFVYEDRTSIRDFLDPRLASYARGLTLLGSMQDHVERYFDHPKLQQVMQYTLVFLGGAPTNTPALYNLMSHVDFNLGVYYPEGGMAGVVDAVATVARQRGVEIRTETTVEKIRGRRGNFTVETEDGAVSADVVVSDADYAHTEQDLLGPSHRQYDAAYWDSRTYAPSAFMLYLGVEGEVPDLAHHTLVLPADWSEHFDRIFENPAWPEDPAYYVSVTSETDDDVAPPGHSAVVILVPIATGLVDSPTIRDRYRDAVLADLTANTGTDLRERIVVEESFAVEDYADAYNAYRGTALGLAHTLRQTSLFRPSRRSSALDGLYFTGAFTTPGIGVPMCLISGQLTAEAVIEDA